MVIYFFFYPYPYDLEILIQLLKVYLQHDVISQRSIHSTQYRIVRIYSLTPVDDTFSDKIYLVSIQMAQVNESSLSKELNKIQYRFNLNNFLNFYQYKKEIFCLV